MATNDTDVTICSAALQLLGENTISSFADGTVQAGICEQLYPDTRDMLLTMYPWSFSLKKIDLQQSSTDPVNEWTYAYPMPADSLTLVPRAVFNSSETGAMPITSGWEILNGELLTNQSIITIDYQARPLEAEMPSYFVQLLKYAMAFHLAEPVTDQVTKSQNWERIAFGNPIDGGRGGYFRQAASIDGAGHGTMFIGDYPLIDTRLSLA